MEYVGSHGLPGVRFYHASRKKNSWIPYSPHWVGCYHSRIYHGTPLFWPTFMFFHGPNVRSKRGSCSWNEVSRFPCWMLDETSTCKEKPLKKLYSSIIIIILLFCPALGPSYNDIPTKNYFTSRDPHRISGHILSHMCWHFCQAKALGFRNDRFRLLWASTKSWRLQLWSGEGEKERRRPFCTSEKKIWQEIDRLQIDHDRPFIWNFGVVTWF